jgi:hypothetical protein
MDNPTSTPVDPNAPTMLDKSAFDMNQPAAPVSSAMQPQMPAPVNNLSTASGFNPQTGVPLSPEAMGQQGTPSAAQQGQPQQPKQAPFMSMLKEFMDGGVPAKKAQKMLEDQMEVIQLIMTAPKSMQGSASAATHLLSMQQESLKNEYGFRSKILDTILAKTLTEDSRKKDRANALELQGVKDTASMERAKVLASSKERVAGIGAEAKKAGSGKPSAQQQSQMDSAYMMLKAVDHLENLRGKIEGQLGPIAGRWSAFKQKKGFTTDKNVSDYITTSQMKIPLYLKAALGGRVPANVLQQYMDILHRPDSTPEQFQGTIRALRSSAHDVLSTIHSGYGSGETGSATNTVDQGITSEELADQL